MPAEASSNGRGPAMGTPRKPGDWMSWARMQPIKRGPKLLLMTLATYIDWSSGETFVSQERLSADCGCSVKQVQRNLRILREFKLVWIDKRWSGRGCRGNLYTLCHCEATWMSLQKSRGKSQPEATSEQVRRDVDVASDSRPGDTDVALSDRRIIEPPFLSSCAHTHEETKQESQEAQIGPREIASRRSIAAVGNPGSATEHPYRATSEATPVSHGVTATMDDLLEALKGDPGPTNSSLRASPTSTAGATKNSSMT